MLPLSFFVICLLSHISIQKHQCTTVQLGMKSLVRGFKGGTFAEELKIMTK